MTATLDDILAALNRNTDEQRMTRRAIRDLADVLGAGDVMLTTGQAAALVGVDPATINRWCMDRSPNLPNAERVGTHWKIPLRDAVAARAAKRKRNERVKLKP